MYHYKQIEDENGVLWRMEFNDEQQKLEIYAETKEPHPFIPEIKCQNSRHIIHLDKHGLQIFNFPFEKKSN